jgi:hypothetical protein
MYKRAMVKVAASGGDIIIGKKLCLNRTQVLDDRLDNTDVPQL